MGNCAILGTTDSPFVVKPRIQTGEFWGSYSINFLVVFLLSIILAGLLQRLLGNWVCSGTVAAMIILLDTAVIFLKNGDGAIAEAEGLTLTHVWLPSRRLQISWANVEAVNAQVFPGRKHRLMRWVSIIFQDENTKRTVRCVYDLNLLHIIVSCAGLTLEESVDNEQLHDENIQDPFETIRRGRPHRQRWIWSRS
jgi:hypothetical protein